MGRHTHDMLSDMLYIRTLTLRLLGATALGTCCFRCLLAGRRGQQGQQQLSSVRSLRVSQCNENNRFDVGVIRV